MTSITATTSLEYAQKFFPWTVSWFPSTKDRLAPLVAAWAKQFPDMKKVVQFVEPYGPWPGMADAHAKGLTDAGVKVLDKVEVPSDAVTFGPLVVKALNEKPDGIVFVCNARLGGEAHQGAEEPRLEEDGPPAGVQQRGRSRPLRHRRQGHQRRGDLQLHQPGPRQPALERVQAGIRGRAQRRAAPEPFHQLLRRGVHDQGSHREDGRHGTARASSRRSAR